MRRPSLLLIAFIALLSLAPVLAQLTQVSDEDYKASSPHWCWAYVSAYCYLESPPDLYNVHRDWDWSDSQFVSAEVYLYPGEGGNSPTGYAYTDVRVWWADGTYLRAYAYIEHPSL